MTAALIVINFLLLYVDIVRLKPVSVSHDEGLGILELEANSTRVHRSIPDFDAVNPSYMDRETLPEEEPRDAQGEVSSFGLADHVSSLFRSHKSANKEQNNQPSQKQRESAMSLVGVSNYGSGLESDEQEECYKQQNIDPPDRRVKDGSPIIDVARGPLPSYVRSDITKDKGGKHYNTKHEETVEITSLYSDPQKILKAKKIKQIPEPGNTARRVYKPVGVRAHFPIYDDDIGFNPDPLQGILDDKYWLDPQEQEAVIRKYISLAANNMVPSGVELAKRSANKLEVKHDSNKHEFKDVSADRGCPCKEVVACGECSKGKPLKKTNSTDHNNGESFGRQLLSFDYSGEMDQEEVGEGVFSSGEKPLSLENKKDEIVNRKAEKTHMDKDVESFTSNYFQRTPLYEYNPLEKDGTVIKDDVEHGNSINVGRKLLWNDEENEESYDDDGGEMQEYSNRKGLDISDSGLGHNFNKRDQLNENTGPFSSAPVFEEGKHNMAGSVNKRLTNQKNNEELVPFENTFFDTPNKPPRYYMPNKLANILQKPLQKKPKGPRKTESTVNPSLEFEAITNDTFKNASLDGAGVPRPNKVYKKPGNERRFLSSKGRRSYSELPFGKHLPVVPLFQSFENLPAEGGSSGLNKTINTSQSAAVTYLPQANISSNSNTKSPNVTFSSMTTMSPMSNINKAKSKSDDEEIIDAEVANDIVETVISESQRSSVLGHNLGICRRNDTYMNENYGKIFPETEKVLKTVSDCIMNKLKSQLAKQSCLLLDPELLEFLKWMVLAGESFKEYKQKLPGKLYHFLPPTHAPNLTTCVPYTTSSSTCEQEESLPPSPLISSDNISLFD